MVRVAVRLARTDEACFPAHGRSYEQSEDLERAKLNEHIQDSHD